MVSPSAFLVLQQRILSVIQNFPWPMASRCNNQRCHSTQSFHCSRQPEGTNKQQSMELDQVATNNAIACTEPLKLTFFFRNNIHQAHSIIQVLLFFLFRDNGVWRNGAINQEQFGYGV
uniref:Uncharacterized protein n=1 Tax=Arundo donax TaxID=35708 RepID=A0A0A9DSL9_ARUDO